MGVNEASYTAWDDNLYEWPPPDGWYQADDGKWWPKGYGPTSADRPGSGDNGTDDALLYEVERTSIFPAGGSRLLGGSSEDRLAAESSRPVYDELPNIDDVFADPDDPPRSSGDHTRNDPGDDEQPITEGMPGLPDAGGFDGDTFTDDADNAGIIELDASDIEAVGGGALTGGTDLDAALAADPEVDDPADAGSDDHGFRAEDPDDADGFSVAAVAEEALLEELGTEAIEDGDDLVDAATDDRSRAGELEGASLDAAFDAVVGELQADEELLAGSPPDDRALDDRAPDELVSDALAADVDAPTEDDAYADDALVGEDPDVAEADERAGDGYVDGDYDDERVGEDRTDRYEDEPYADEDRTDRYEDEPYADAGQIDRYEDEDEAYAEDRPVDHDADDSFVDDLGVGPGGEAPVDDATHADLGEEADYVDHVDGGHTDHAATEEHAEAVADHAADDENVDDGDFDDGELDSRDLDDVDVDDYHDAEEATDDHQPSPEASMVSGFHLGELPEDGEAAVEPDGDDRHPDEHDPGDGGADGEGPARPMWPIVAAAAGGIAVLVGVFAYILVGRDDGPVGFDVDAALAATGEGSLSQPYPAGSGAIVYYPDAASGDERRWVIQILEPVSDRTEEFVAERGAAAPDAGSVLAVTTVRVTYRSGPTPGPVDELSMASIGSSLELFDAETSCTGVTDELDRTVGLEPGQAIEGDLCWEIPEGDLEDLKLAIEARPVEGMVFVDLG